MSKIEKHAEALSQMVGTMVKQILGKDADFIFIPMVKTKDEMEAAVISSFHGKELSFHLAVMASQTIDREDSRVSGSQDHICDDCKETKPH